MSERVGGLAGHTMAYVGDARFYRDPDARLLVTVRTLIDALTGRLCIDSARRTFTARRRAPDKARISVGNATHRMVAEHARGAGMVPHDGDPPEATHIARNIARELDRSAADVQAVEQNLVSVARRIGGTVDLVAFWDGKLAVIDHKTRRSVTAPARPPRNAGTAPAHPDAFLQAAAYAHMWSETMGDIPESLVILVADAHVCVPTVRDAGPWMREMASEKVTRTVRQMCEIGEAALEDDPDPTSPAHSAQARRR